MNYIFNLLLTNSVNQGVVNGKMRYKGCLRSETRCSIDQSELIDAAVSEQERIQG